MTHLMTSFGVLFLLSAPSFAQGAAFAPGTYGIDPAHSSIGFEIPHLVISTVEGRFNEYEGEVTLGQELKDSKVQVSINAASIDTGIAKRDEHLRSADFLESGKNPKILFKSKRFSGSPEKLRILGDLTIRGVTKEVTLDGKYLGAVKDGYGNLKVAFQAATKINRKDFGLTWSNAVEAGPVVGDEVTVSLRIQAAKPQKQAAR